MYITQLPKEAVDELGKAFKKERVGRQKIRYQAIWLVAKGWKREKVSEVVGMSRDRIRQLITLYHKGGLLGLLLKPALGNHRLLTKEQKQQIKNLITTKTPQQLGLTGRFWTNRKDYVVLVADECRIQRESSLQSIWQQKGQQELVKVDQKKEGTSLYGALDVKTGKCHLWNTDKQNSQNSVRFLKQLADYYQGKQVFLIWDGASWHRGEVKKYLKDKYKKCKLTLMYFPAYSPELNPQEHVWKRAKQQTVHNSEEPYEEKLYQFRQFITHTTFKTNFLTKPA